MVLQKKRIINKSCTHTHTERSQPPIRYRKNIVTFSTGQRINFQAQLFEKLFQLDYPHNLKKNKNRLETCRSKSNLIANSIGDKKER